jgi:MFS family permease
VISLRNRGELLAPAIALSLCAAVAIVIGSAFASGLPFVDQAGAGGRALFAISAVLAVTAVIVAQLLVHNGIAVSFPAWVELKAAAGAAAMEMNVRMMIVMYGALLVLAFVLVIPAAAAAVAYFVAGGLLIPSAIFAALLICESVAATEIIGRTLDRTDLHPRTNLLLAQIAKSLRQRHLSSQIWSAVLRG